MSAAVEAALRGGVATGVGSWPGTDPREAAATVVGELPGLAHLVELPARGVGADLLGRGCALLVDLPFDSTTRGYRFAARPGGVARRAYDLLRTDLDALEEAWAKVGAPGTGRPVKLQVAGPLTLAAEVELVNGHRVLTDPGARRDLAESLAEGLARHAAEVGKRLDAPVVLQLDEPLAGSVLEGALRGVSGLDTVRPLPEPEALDLLDTVIRAQRVPVIVHSCAEPPPLALFRASGAAALAIDVAVLRARDLDGVGETLDAGKLLVLGLVPSTEPAGAPGWRELAEPGARLVDRLGFPRRTLAERVLVSPACGLAGATPEWARRALDLTADIARAYTEEPETLGAE
ncbi:methionine synthase [Nocardia asteroides]|uniref:methionine synthase n=1 Tax=Nocardia asteroides TaxID=1824 RepID=UPI001E47159A|nr:methionine synthase [Nocardia asteroides]UGT63817.1 methionine synthase [Nocardia asteroides]